jgi:hypothetical protein
MGGFHCVSERVESGVHLGQSLSEIQHAMSSAAWLNFSKRVHATAHTHGALLDPSLALWATRVERQANSREWIGVRIEVGPSGDEGEGLLYGSAGAEPLPGGWFPCSGVPKGQELAEDVSGQPLGLAMPGIEACLHPLGHPPSGHVSDLPPRRGERLASDAVAYLLLHHRPWAVLEVQNLGQPSNRQIS